MSNYKISFMEKNEIRESAKVLSTAMVNNPLHVAVFQGNGEKERMELENMFYDLLVESPEIVFVVKENHKIIGVMRMKSCLGGDDANGPADPNSENELSRRVSIWHSEWARNEPPVQHWHLGPIGVLPSHQGKGIGAILMERFCKEVDACGAKAYLETDFDKNVRFYNKFGFDMVSENEILGARSRYMSREANS